MDCPCLARQTKKYMDNTETRLDFVNKALKHAADVETFNGELFSLNRSRQLKVDTAAAREAEIYSKVCSEVDEGGKAKFSNDGARKAEALSRSSKDAILSQLGKDIAELDQRIAQKRYRIEYLNTCIGIQKAFLHGS